MKKDSVEIVFFYTKTIAIEHKYTATHNIIMRTKGNNPKGDCTMPFTPFHLGPALGLGLPLRKYIHAPTFIVANVAVDIEPFLVFLLRLNYPLHGYLHTFLSAFFFGLAIGFAMFYLEKFLHPLYKTLLLTPNGTQE